MQKIFLYQVYTNLAYVPPTYRRIKKLQVLVINKELCKSLARKNGNEILIWIWNNPYVNIGYAYCTSDQFIFDANMLKELPLKKIIENYMW